MTDLVTRDRESLWHPYASVTRDAPLYSVVAASGSHLTLSDGRVLVDGMSSWWAAIHGYRHPLLDDALRTQLHTFSHVMFGGLTHQPAVELAELLVLITPAELTRVFFADSGSVAVEVAIKMALQYWQGKGRPERHRILTVRGGYHGDTVGAMSVSDPDAGIHSLFRSHLSQQLFLPRPRPVFGDPVKDEDLEDVRRLLTEQGHTLAALIIEPIVQGAGGMHFYSADYLRELVHLCRQHGLLVIFDEIATGFGRTGSLFAMDEALVAPDILCLGKALTGGYVSLAATVCTDEVASAVCASSAGALMHGPTFMANPLACAVALASTRLLLHGPTSQRVRAIESQLTQQLEPCRDLPGVADVRVLGAIGVVETVEPVDMSVLQPALVDRGAWIRPFGRLVYTMPPYVITPAELTVVTGAITSALSLPDALQRPGSGR